ncbi:MAG: shikimate kinase [Chloroflexi bacterium]|nr:MAG: shikimate kinase [Chloroflexota bacterium]
MGSGKTVVGALAAQRANAPFFDLDHLVEDKAGMSIAEIFATHSEEAFRALEKETLPTVLQPDSVVALGGGVVLDDDNWRQICREAMTVFLDVPFETIWERIRDLPGRPLITSRTEPEVRALYEVRRPRYEEATYTVDGRQPAGALADEVLKLWSV